MAEVSPVALQKWQGCAQSCRFGNGGKPSRGADDAGNGLAGEELPEARMVAELLARFACNAMTIVDDELREARCATCDRARAVSRWPGTTKCGVNRGAVVYTIRDAPCARVLSVVPSDCPRTMPRDSMLAGFHASGIPC